MNALENAEHLMRGAPAFCGCSGPMLCADQFGVSEANAVETSPNYITRRRPSVLRKIKPGLRIDKGMPPTIQENSYAAECMA